MIPSVLRTLRQSTFTSQHAACTAVPNYTAGIGVGNWGSENFKLFMLLDMTSQPLVWNCSHIARDPSRGRVAIGQSSHSGLFITIKATQPRFDEANISRSTLSLYWVWIWVFRRFRSSVHGGATLFHELVVFLVINFYSFALLERLKSRFRTFQRTFRAWKIWFHKAHIGK